MFLGMLPRFSLLSIPSHNYTFEFVIRDFIVESFFLYFSIFYRTTSLTISSFSVVFFLNDMNVKSIKTSI